MSYLAYLTLPAAFLLVVFALGELAVPRVQRRNVLLALIFGGFALILVRAFFLLSGWIVHVPHLYELSLPVNFFLGPLIRAYVRQAAGLPGAARLRLAWHFVPGLIVLVLLIPGFLEPGAQKIERILAFQAYLQSRAPLSDPTMLVFPLGILHAGVYFAWIVREIFV
jgi:hypothetical protein